MITISLDECGEGFEKVRLRGTELMMIAGSMFDDGGDDAETDRERNRLDAYYSRICSDVHAVYPTDLHFSNSNSRPLAVADVKERVRQTLPEFLQKGTYDGKEILGKRKGRYLLYAMVYGSDKTSRTDRGSNELTNDKTASNLYLNMAEDVTTRLVYHNPDPAAKDFYLDLATRLAVVNGNGRAAKRQKKPYEDAGYDSRIDPGKTKYYIANVSGYRAAFRREDLYSARRDIHIHKFRTEPINYWTDKPKSQVFRYLADSICSIISFQFHKASGKTLLETVAGKMQRLAGNSFYLYSYDDIDDDYARALHHLEQKNLYGVLSCLCDARERTGLSSLSWYQDHWFHDLRRLMRDPRIFSGAQKARAVQQLSDETRADNIDTLRLHQMFEELEPICEDSKDPKLIYELNEAGMAAFNHVGDYKKAMDCYTLCEKNAGAVGLARFVDTRNREAVALGDSFAYEKAIAFSRGTIHMKEEEQKLLCELGIISKTQENAAVGRCYSQLAQNLSFAGKYPEAEEMFLKSLSCYVKGSPDERITQSYLMHLYLETGDRASYEAAAKDYFGTADRDEQMEIICREGLGKNARFTFRFALYIYLRALYVFYRDALTKKQKDWIRFPLSQWLVRQNPLAKKQLEGHPWEISWKYCALLANHLGDQDAAQSYMDLVKKTDTDQDHVVAQISQYSSCEYDRITGNQAAAKETAEKLYRTLAEEKVADCQNRNISTEEKEQVLKKLFTYMYH